MWLVRSCLRCLNGCVLWCARLSILVAMMLGVAVWAAHRAPVALPDMAVAGLVAVLERRAGLAGLSVGLEGADVALRGGLVPRLVLHGVALRRTDGTEILALAQAEAVFSRRAAVQGRIAPVTIAARGLTVGLERGAGGEITLRLGDAALVEAAPDAATALARLRDVLDSPALAGLRRVGLEDATLGLRDAVEGRVLVFSDGVLRLDRTGPALRLDLSAGVSGERTDDTGGGVVALQLDVAAAGTGAASADGRGGADAAETGDDAMARLRVMLRGVEPARLAGLAGPTPLGATLSRIAAPVSLDLEGGLGRDGRALPFSGSLRVGAGLLGLPGGDGVVPIDRARADLRLSPDRRHLELRDMVFDSAGARLAGQADLRSAAGAATGGGITAQLALHDVAVDLPRAGRTPMALRADRLWADLRMGGPDGVIDLAAVTVERDGARGSGQGRIQPGGRLSLDLAASGLDVEGALALWPAEIAPRARIWMAQAVSSGTIDDLRLSLRHDLGNPRVAGRFDRTALSFALKDGAMWINPGLPPVTGVAGQVVIDHDRATLLLSGARMDPSPETGPVWFGPGEIWTDTGPEATGPLRVRLDASGDLPAALAMLQAPLFQPAQAASDTTGAPAGPGAVLMTPGAVTGRAAVTVEITLPLRRSGPPLDAGLRPDFTVTGAILDAQSDVLVPGRTARAERLELYADQLRLRIAGPAQVATLPVEMVYSRALVPPQTTRPRPVPRGQTADLVSPRSGPGRGRLVADVPLRPADLAEAGLALPPGALQGEGRARVQVDFADAGPPALSLDADLSGLAVSLPGFGIEKAARAPGRITAQGRFGAALTLDRATLDMPGTAVVLRLPDGWAGGVQFDRLALGGWLDTRGRFDPAAAGQPARLRLTGGSADLRAMTRRGSGSAGQAAVAIDLALDRVMLADGIALTGLRGGLSPALHGVLDARVNGAAPVRLRLAPGEGAPPDRGPAVHLTADDGGAVLRAAGLASGVRAGALDLRLVPAAERGRYRGQLRLSGLALPQGGAAALRAGGMPDLDTAAGGGLVFDDLRAEFTVDPARIDVLSASATGSSLGLAVDGRVDLRTRTLAMQGVVSPLYFLNRMGAFMTRQGEGLIGLHFRLTGPIDAPELTANPLSVLAPGPLRDMFRMRPPAPPDQGTEDRE